MPSKYNDVDWMQKDAESRQPAIATFKLLLSLETGSMSGLPVEAVVEASYVP